MNCQKCKNPVKENSEFCDWCGNQIANHVEKTQFFEESNSKFNSNQYKVKSEKYFIFFIPGIVVLIVWLLGNLLSERDKHAIFNMDDLRPILYLGLVFLGIGGVVKFFNRQS